MFENLKILYFFWYIFANEMFDVDTSHEKLCRSRRAETEIVQRSITIVYNLLKIRPDLYTLDYKTSNWKNKYLWHLEILKPWMVTIRRRDISKLPTKHIAVNTRWVPKFPNCPKKYESICSTKCIYLWFIHINSMIKGHNVVNCLIICKCHEVLLHWV